VQVEVRRQAAPYVCLWDVSIPAELRGPACTRCASDLPRNVRPRTQAVRQTCPYSKAAQCLQQQTRLLRAILSSCFCEPCTRASYSSSAAAACTMTLASVGVSSERYNQPASNRADRVRASGLQCVEMHRSMFDAVNPEYAANRQLRTRLPAALALNAAHSAGLHWRQVTQGCAGGGTGSAAARAGHGVPSHVVAPQARQHSREGPCMVRVMDSDRKPSRRSRAWPR
jgi:hypothetical protein